MPLHLIKLSVGCATPEELEQWQGSRIRSGIPLIHRTRHMPKRAAEIVDGGSLYWVFKGFVRARQVITRLEKGADEEGRGFCTIHLAPGLIRTRAKAQRPFQGWRYLSAETAAMDATGNNDETEEMPEELTLELQRLGIF